MDSQTDTILHVIVFVIIKCVRAYSICIISKFVEQLLDTLKGLIFETHLTQKHVLKINIIDSFLIVDNNFN